MEILRICLVKWGSPSRQLPLVRNDGVILSSLPSKQLLLMSKKNLCGYKAHGLWTDHLAYAMFWNLSVKCKNSITKFLRVKVPLFKTLYTSKRFRLADTHMLVWNSQLFFWYLADTICIDRVRILIGYTEKEIWSQTFWRWSSHYGMPGVCFWRGQGRKTLKTTATSPRSKES